MENSQVLCSHCGSQAAIRISREGFFQCQVLSRLGIYPWKCGACGTAFLFPKRGYRRHGSSQPVHSGQA